MTPTERGFLYASGLHLLPQPFTIQGPNYRPDFYCPETGTIYEVTTCKISRHTRDGGLGSATLLAPVYIVYASMNHTNLKICEYRHLGEVTIPWKIHVPPVKETYFINELKKNITKGGNLNILNLMNYGIQKPLEDSTIILTAENNQFFVI